MERAPWVHRRMAELPRYAIFLYNTLIDQRLSWSQKEHPFAALRYLFDDDGLIPNDDPVLGRLDDTVMVIACLETSFRIIPEGVVDLYGQDLARHGIDPHEVVEDAPEVLGTFWTHLSGLYRELPARHRHALGNAIETGSLVRDLQAWLERYDPPPPDSGRLSAIEKFLKAYR